MAKNRKTSEMETLSQVLETLRQRGYTADFNILMNPKKTASAISPDEVFIEKTYRFEGNTDPGDEAILYAVQARKSGLKGVLINGYGIYSDEFVNSIAKKIKIRKHRSTNGKSR